MLLYCRTRHSHSSTYTNTPTVRRHRTPETREFKPPSLLFLYVSAVQLYCVPLCNCTHIHGGWVGGAWMVLLLYSCTAVALPGCYSRPPPPPRSIDRAAPSIARRHRRPGVVRRPSSIARRRSPAAALVSINHKMGIEFPDRVGRRSNTVIGFSTPCRYS